MLNSQSTPPFPPIVAPPTAKEVFAAGTPKGIGTDVNINNTLLRAVILTYADKQALPGLQVLLSSLRRNGNVGNTPIYALSADPKVLKDPLVRELSDIVKEVSTKPYEDINPDSSRLGISAYIKGFEAFRDYGAEINLMLDADILCLGDISELLKPTRYDLRAVQDGCGNRLRHLDEGGYVEINTGVLVVNRSIQGGSSFSDLLKAAKKNITLGSGIADQGVINSWIYRKQVSVDLLPLLYNFYWGAFPESKSNFQYAFWKTATKIHKGARLVHFSHYPKPWQAGAPKDSPPVRKWWKIHSNLKMPKLHYLFERCLTINLDARQDRWERFKADLPSDWPFTTPRRISAVAGNNAKPPAWWGQKRPNAAAWGCYRSHLRILEDCLSQGVESAFIMEDDALFAPDFARSVDTFLKHVPDDWDMLYLGGWHADEPEEINDYVLRGRYILCNHAYAIRGEAIQIAYKHLTSNSWGSPMPWDNRLALLHPRLQVYTPRKFLVGQAAGWSNISNKLQAEHWWNQPTPLPAHPGISRTVKRTKVVVATEVWDTLELLPHFLDHYDRLGCAKILIAVAGANRDLLSSVKETTKAARIPTVVRWFESERYDNEMNSISPRTMLERENLDSNDWIIYADLDEFHEYPAPLSEIVKESNKRGIPAISSELLDRVARGGRLPPIQEYPTIGEQFPIGCRLSLRRLRTFSKKILMCRWGCDMRCAGHHQINGIKADQWPIGNSGQYFIHHFKWNSGVLCRLARRLEGANINENYAGECKLFLELYAEAGRIDFAGLDAHERGRLIVR